MQYSEETKIRLEKIKRMKDAWIIPYAAKFDKKNNIADIVLMSQNDFRDINDIIKDPKKEISTAWRIVLYRSFWKISFAKLQDSTWEIQIMFSRENCSIDTWSEVKTEITEEMTAFKFMEKLVDVWDYIWISWELFITHKWELTIFAKEFKFLSKAIRPLPEKFHWIQDQEALYRQRYLDMIMNKETYDRFLFKSAFYRTLREFYTKEWFVELQTPILWNSASWAAAAPFITHHNDFDIDVYLRIAFETSLKKATVWRFEKVFEIWQDFRNEWSDPSHWQEFTQVEHYAAFWDYKDNMVFAEKLFDYIFDTLNISRKLKVKDKEWNIKEVDFTTPWARIDYVEQIKKDSWIDVSKYSRDDTERLLKDIKDAWIKFDWMDKMFAPTLVDYLYKKVTRPKILWPAFIYNYPSTMQPLARISDADNNIVEQFQLLVNWWEICKAYSELVDPVTQQDNFNKQAQASQLWDEEATQWDDDFVLAMEYWMPPQSWFWMWLERILAILTEQDNLRDVVLFPLTRPM